MTKFYTFYKQDYDNIFPHEFDNYCIIVPKGRKIIFSLGQVFESFVLKSVPFVLIIFVIFWKKLRRHKEFDWSHVTIDILGIYLATNANHRSFHCSERLLLVSLFIFTQVTVVAMCGLLYQSMVIASFDSEINTLQQLGDSELDIMINKDFGQRILIGDDILE